MIIQNLICQIITDIKRGTHFESASFQDLADLCMVDGQASFFFPRLHQHVSIELVIRAATDGALLDEQFQAVVAGGTEVDLLFTTLAELLR